MFIVAIYCQNQPVPLNTSNYKFEVKLTRLRKRFANNLKSIREEKKLTQEQLAERLNISVRYVQRLESKSCPNVKLDTIDNLSRALRVRPIEFLSH